MQAGSIDPKTPLEAIKRGRLPVGTTHGVGVFPSDHAGDSAESVPVELASAVSHVSASSSVIELRQEPQRSPTQEAALAHPEGSQATSLKLSTEAQRLALIPAEVLDADEIAELREQVEEAQLQLNAEMEAHRIEMRQSRTSNPPPSGVAAMSALQGRSPFESSAPGATGQSLDIIVGESVPPSRFPG